MKILKAAREKQLIICKVLSIIFKWILHQKPCRAAGSRMIYSKYRKERKKEEKKERKRERGKQKP
jgi:hypothetical protein